MEIEDEEAGRWRGEEEEEEEEEEEGIEGEDSLEDGKEKEREEGDEKEREEGGEDEEEIMQPVEGKRRSRFLRLLFFMGKLGLFQYMILTLLLTLGGFIFNEIEYEMDLDYAEAIYWATITVSTIGYGDITPQTEGGKVFTVIFSFIALPYFLYVTSILWDLISRIGYFIFQTLLGIQDFEIHNPAIPQWKKHLLSGSPLIFALFIFMMSIFLGALVFANIEDWSYGNGMYFCYITQTTIGYGDFHPTTKAGRIVAIFYAIWNITTLGAIFSATSELMKKRNQIRRDKLIAHIEKNTAIKIKRKKETSEEEKAKKKIDNLFTSLTLLEKSYLYQKIQEESEKGGGEGEREEEEERERREGSSSSSSSISSEKKKKKWWKRSGEGEGEGGGEGERGVGLWKKWWKRSGEGEGEGEGEGGGEGEGEGTEMVEVNLG